MPRKGGRRETTPKRYWPASEYLNPPTKEQIAQIEKNRKWKRDQKWLETNPAINREIEMATLSNPSKTPEQIASLMRQGLPAVSHQGKPVPRDLIVRRIAETKRRLAKLGPRMVDIISEAVEGALSEGEFDVAARHAANALKMISHKDKEGQSHRVVDDGEKAAAASGITVNIGMVPGGAEPPKIAVQVVTPDPPEDPL